MKQRLTSRQCDIAVAVREIAKIPDTDAWGLFTDFTHCIARIIEGSEALIHPAQMQKRFNQAWRKYAGIWTSENERIVRDCLGSQEEFDRVKSHPNGEAAIGRILSRVVEIHGELTPGIDVADVEIGDILAQELGEETA